MKFIFDNEFTEKVKELIGKPKILENLNQLFELQTGIEKFFHNYNDFTEFLNFHISGHKNIREDLGDFQTPLHLTDKICEYFLNVGVFPEVILEPTCGAGNFILSAIKIFPSLRHIYCVEIQPEYEWLFKLNILMLSLEQKINLKIEFYRDNIFTHSFSDRFLNFLKHRKKKNFLILGNPPWITNSELSLLNSRNLPSKSNLKSVKGLEAMTGSANFDIAESIILKLIQTFSFTNGILGMLCKTNVVKNIVRDMPKLKLKLSNLHSLSIDSKKEFKISADSSLLLTKLGEIAENHCTISSLYEPNKILKKFGWFEEKFVSDIDTYKEHKDIDGKSEVEWRQGVKHDAIDVMVLIQEKDGNYSNGQGDLVNIEDDLLYPFVKGSNLRDFIIRDTKLRIIITQKYLNHNNNHIEKRYPKTWNYLNFHSEKLEARKSKIYKNSKYKFSIFGIGDYSFKPFKIAIAGFYKKPIFTLLLPVYGKPIMVDDTCYQIAFDNLGNAFFTWILLNLNDTINFLSSIVFLESKRPFTKKVLMRINLMNLAEKTRYTELKDFYDKELRFHYDFSFNENDYKKYKQNFKEKLMYIPINSFF
jgi:predicted RNA methylase